MSPQEERPSLQKRSLEDIAAAQAEHTLFFSRIVETIDEHTRRFDLVDDRLNQMYDEINAHTLLLHQILDRLPAKD